MTNFESFSLVWENLVEYFFGSYIALSIFLILIFMVVLLARGLDFRFATLFALPLVGFFVAIGWFGSLGAAQWIVNLVLIGVGFIYAFAVLRLTT